MSGALNFFAQLNRYAASLLSIPLILKTFFKPLKNEYREGLVLFSVLAGIFINSESSRADLLLVGDKLKKARLNNFFSWLESEIGKELNYVVMSTDEFKYRMDMYDRFVRDILEFPHEKLINKLHV